MANRLVEIGSRNYTAVYSLDDPGVGGAYHEYVIKTTETNEICARINFQKGSVIEEGVNGCFIEDLLAICLDRLQEFQSGPFFCRENDKAITNIESALYWLRKRTEDQMNQAVEGC